MLAVIFVAGLFIGSFLGVVIKRFDKPTSIIVQPSHCDKCKKRLGVLDLVPVLSFLILRGRCRFCRQPISWFYPLIELATAAILTLNWYFLSQQGQTLATIMLYCIMALALIVVAGIDLAKMIVPDSLVILIAFLALIALVYSGNYIEAIWGAVAGAGFLGLLALAGKGKWMGWGDVKLAGALGLWLGLNLMISSLCLAFVIGSLISIILLAGKIKKIKDHLPFAPFLIAGALVALWLNFSIIEYIWY